MLTNYTASQFSQLTHLDKIELLEEDSTYLDAYRLAGRYKVALFAYNGYYVEVFLNLATDCIDRVEPLASYSALDPYLEQISLLPIYSALSLSR